MSDTTIQIPSYLLLLTALIIKRVWVCLPASGIGNQVEDSNKRSAAPRLNEKAKAVVARKHNDGPTINLKTSPMKLDEMAHFLGTQHKKRQKKRIEKLQAFTRSSDMLGAS